MRSEGRRGPSAAGRGRVILVGAGPGDPGLLTLRAAEALARCDVVIYDALGSPHVATITYTKQAAAGAWNYAVTVPGEDVAGGTAGTPYSVGTGSLQFSSGGLLSAVNGGAPADVSLSLPAWINGATASSLSWNLVEPDGSATLSGSGSATR